ncbi:MAG: sigma-70 family RNA polymerase sigma factor [Myxococcota bacterium]
MAPDPPARRPAEGLEAIYRKHHGLVRWVLRARGVPEAALDDQVHEVFVAICRRLPERNPEVPLRTWVAGVARNVGFSHRRSAARRKRQTEGLAPNDDAPVRPDELFEQREAWRALEQFLEDLGPRHREVFVMVEMTGMRVSEVAESMGLPPNTLHSRLKVARTRFSQRFVEPDETRAEVVRRARRRGHASPEQRRRTWGLIVASTRGGGLLPVASPLAAAPAKLAALFGSPWLTGSMIATAIVIAGVTVFASEGPEPPRHKHETVASAVESKDAAAPSETPGNEAFAPPPIAALPSERVADPSRSTVAQPETKDRKRPAQSPKPATANDPLATTVAALSKARSLLAAGRPRPALARLDALPSNVGALERDRRRLELEARCALGEDAKARGAAQALARMGATVDTESPCG